MLFEKVILEMKETLLTNKNTVKIIEIMDEHWQNLLH